MGYEAHYPDFDAPLVSFTPEKNPIIDGHDEAREKGIIAEQTRDGTVYAYKAGGRFQRYRFVFDVDLDELDELDAFVEAVGGAQFEFREDTTCGAIITPTVAWIAPGAHTLRPQRTGSSRYRIPFEVIVPESGS